MFHPLFSRLQIELDIWLQAGLSATFWWRDDDAVCASSALDRLISASSEAGLLLATIPKQADSSLADAIASHAHITIAQHGYAHINHAPRGQGLGAWELGLHRGEQAVMDDLAQGYEMLSGLFADHLIAVVVPPWNRIDPALYQPLQQSGYCGVSAFGSNQLLEPVSGLIQLNCHCDPINWKTGARFTGTEKSIAMICEHLQSRRNETTRLDEPTGLLTHHLDMDDESWDFVSQLNQVIIEHPAACWCDPKQLFNAKP